MSADSWAVRLYEAVRRYVLPWPVRDTYLRATPVDTDDEVRRYSDLQYMQDLEDAILADCHHAKTELGLDIFADFIARPLIQLLDIPVESQNFWQTWDWPDRAADLLSLWRFDREMQAWADGDEILGQDAA